jgi:ABC-type branched-subunit amino acid transport system substrate-binding protein
MQGQTIYAVHARFRQVIFPLVIVILTFLGTNTHAASRELLVGMSAAFTGPSQDIGCKLYRDAMAYLQHINKQGGVHGNTIRLLALDDGYNPDPTIANTIHFVDQDNIFCLFNYVGTPTVTRMLPLLSRYASRPLYLLFPFTGAEPQREPPYDQMVMNFRTSYQAEIRALIDRFCRQGYSRFAILYQADAYGRSGWQSTIKALAAHHLTLVGQASYQRGRQFEDSFSEQVKILTSSCPEVIISIAASEAAAGFIRDARDFDLQVPIANISFVDPNTLINLLGPLGKAQHRNYLSNLINSQAVPFFADLNLPACQEFLKLIDTTKDIPTKTECLTAIESFEQPGPISFEGFLNAKLLVNLLEILGPDPKAEDLPRAFSQLEGVDIGIGHVLNVDTARNQINNPVHFISFGNATMIPVDRAMLQNAAP